MNNDIIAHASILTLSRKDIYVLKITDAYSLHRVIYGLYPKLRKNEEINQSSGILWCDQGGDLHTRRILLLSKNIPHQTPQFGSVKTVPIATNFLNYAQYNFKLKVNPVKRSALKHDSTKHKDEAIKGYDAIRSWVLERAEKSWGFSIKPQSLEIQINPIQQFTNGLQTITHNSVSLQGELTVINRAQFQKSFTQGIGRGKTFGFGLLQIVPLN